MSLGSRALALGLLLGFAGGNPIKCLVGWGGEERVIPTERINDGYCDCPLDGMDEPNTEACSGSTGWTGISGQGQHDTSQPLYQCPQQPKLQLPLSRVNDGICDCCDGSDEAMGCFDICDQVLAAERAAQARAVESFSIGSAKRQELLEEFRVLRQDTLQEISVKQEELTKVQANVEKLETDIGKEKRIYMLERLELAKGIHKSMKDLVEPLHQEELVALIVQTCQLSGEMKSSGSTCEQLRLAGMDMGFTWRDENVATGTATFRQMLQEDNGWETIANLMDTHDREEHLDWSGTSEKKDTHSSRQKQNHVYDEEDDYEDDHYGADDDYYFDDDVDDDHGGSHSKEDNANVNDDIRLEVRNSNLSNFRVRFLKNAQVLIQKIDELTSDDDDDDEVEDEGEEKSDEGDKNDKSVDPMALRMVKSTLQRRQKSIERGFDYAASGLVLARAVIDQAGVDSAELKSWLSDLAVGTMLYGNISSQDVWQLTVMNVEEFGYKVSGIEESCTSESDAEACAASESAAFDAYLAGTCPPRVIESRSKSFPAEPIVNAAYALCEKLSASSPTMACSKADDEIPSDIPDGYCGYFEVQPRHPAEYLGAKYAPLESFGPSLQLVELNQDLQEEQNALKDLENTIDELYEKIGGKEQDNFGANGELHSLADVCHSMDAGKYTYEVCLFGKATQRDRDEKRGSGTDLGRWKGMTRDTASGERVMTWSGGTKCWNGPQRSATVFVTCGTENKILSAEEPETCRYELEMESPIACDEEYKERFGL